jgi:chaperonin GroES
MKSCQPGLLPAPRRRFASHGEAAQLSMNFADVEGEVRVSVSIKPLEDRIVVRPLEAEQTTASGLVIPDSAQEKPQEGEVVAVGPGRFEDGNRVPVDVAVGDVVIYSKYGGTEVKTGGTEYLVLSARDVLAIVVK